MNSSDATISSNNPLPYTDFNANFGGHREFNRKFVQNPFGLVCNICDRLWFKNDLTRLPNHFKRLVSVDFPEADLDNMIICKHCTTSLSYNHIPIFAKSNGFQYPERPDYLPQLDPISERLISPRIPLRKIQRLRHVNTHFEKLIQIINIPVAENNMVHHLPRDMNDVYCTYVDIERTQVRRTNHFTETVNKQDIVTWLQYLATSSLYKTHDITIDESFNDTKSNSKERDNEMIYHQPNRDSVIAEQHTLLWNIDKYLNKNDKEGEDADRRLYDGNAEELSFPCIYFGQPRVFKEGLKVTPSMIISSELTRADRRGVTPDHLLYMAMKIMRLRVRETLNSACSNAEGDTNTVKQQILSEETFDQCLGSNLGFLRCIPNSIWFWKERKRDLLATMRHLGRPTLSLTISANEISWIPLLQLLYKLRNNGKGISEEAASALNYVEKSRLVNDDVVTCVIYFNKLVNVLISLLRGQDDNPFQKYRVIHHFQRIEFQYHRSPCVHILFWLENAPKDPLGADKEAAISLIDQLMSVATREASGHIELQAHKHTSACYKKGAIRTCRFHAPFMPCRSTMILEPSDKTGPEFMRNARHFENIRKNLENCSYSDLATFYKANKIFSDVQYVNILRTGITRPRVFLKREPSEKWHEAFNPFILNVLQGHMNIQFLPDERSCADFVVDYVNRTDRGITELQDKIIEIMDQNSELKLSEIFRRLSGDLLNTVEFTSQEAAWYLLREPISKSSSTIAHIQTVWPSARQAIRRNYDEYGELEIENENFWKESWFVMYEKRPADLETVTLAQFVAHYTRNFSNTAYVKRKTPRIIRYQNYNRFTRLKDYKREMVTLHVPFRNEKRDVLADRKFLELYDKHRQVIRANRKEFESDMDIQAIMDRCNQLCRKEDVIDDEIDVNYLGATSTEHDPFEELYNPRNAAITNSKYSGVNNQFEFMAVDEISSDVDSQENSLDDVSSCEPVFILPEEIEIHPMHGMFRLLTGNDSPFDVFLSGPANCKKIFISRLLMEIYNCHEKSGTCNVYMNLGITDKSEMLVNQSTTYTALSVSFADVLNLSPEASRKYRDLFEYVQVLIIGDNNEMNGLLLSQIDKILKQLTNNSTLHFGGIDIILTGDYKKLPELQWRSIHLVWDELKFFDLTKIISQSNRLFSLLLSKIGRNVDLDEAELQLLESRFFSREEANRVIPDGVHLMLSEEAVDEYNKSIIRSSKDKVISEANDTHISDDKIEQRQSIQSLRDVPLAQAGGLPYEIIFVMNKMYMLIACVDDLPGVQFGFLGKLVHIEHEKDKIKCIWLEFYNMPPNNLSTNINICIYKRKNKISEKAVPIRRHTSKIFANDEKTIIGTRCQFPLVSAWAMTISDSQGSHFNEIVYEYSRGHSQQVLHMALSHISNVTKLYIVTPNNDPTFHQGRKKVSITSLQKSRGIAVEKPMIMAKAIIDFINSRSQLALLSFSCQDLRNSEDVNAIVNMKSKILLLAEMSSEKDEALVMPDFNCTARFKRSGAISGPAAIYQSARDRTRVVTCHMDVYLRQSTCLIVNSSRVGEICAARCNLDNSQTILTVIMYVSANREISQIITFLNEVLLKYTIQGAALLGTDFDKIPIILSGDFNIDFDSPEAQPLVQFLDTEFNLKLTRDATSTSVKSRSIINSVFSRYLEKLQLTTYVSYFSYDRPSDSTHETFQEMDIL
ncbi:uncharacterized protein [Fopius arisanus]|uniref:ATP-dependent DNA helicase n=3 Tax=Fopius arisanus TaxID=64838 RepID=A0A9R1T485_9HYME|nr:PREDICTED: uncharacterized protein LOC105266439 [Fopius arisanus]